MSHIVKMHVHCQRSKLASVLNKKKVYPQLYRITKRTIHTPTFFVSSNAVNHSAEAFSKETKNAYNQKKSWWFRQKQGRRFDILGWHRGRGALIVITKALSREASPANLIPRGEKGEGRFLLSVPQDSSERDSWEKGHRMALSSGSPVSEDVWALIKMCRASGDATPTSTANHLFPLLLLYASSSSPSCFLSFQRSRHFPFSASGRMFVRPTIVSFLPDSRTLLARSLRAIAREENRNFKALNGGMPLGRQLPRFVHTYTRSWDTCRGCVVTSCERQLARIRGVPRIFARELSVSIANQR